MFGLCTPVWRVDDFTHCFQRDFLQILLPLLACALSFVILSVQTARRVLRASQTVDHPGLPNGHGPRGAVDASTPSYETLVDDNEQQAFLDDEGEGHEPDLSLQRTKSNTNESVLEVDRPRGKLTSIVLEELAVLGEVAIHITALVTNAGGPNGTVAIVAGLVSWIYVLALTSMRLLLAGASQHSFPAVWYHTALLYAFQWLCTTLIFRSTIIHPRSLLAQILTITEFALVTLLCTIAVTTRKGNKAVVLEIEDGLQPSREPLASVFSLATFSWVDAIVWQGYQRPFELADVWNLAPKDKAAAILRDFRQVRRTSGLAWHFLKYFRRDFLIQAGWAAFSGVLTFVPTLLLKAILEYVEDPDRIPANAAWFYVILLFFTGAAQALADGQALWTGRRISLRLRALTLGEIYAKTLRRKAAAASDTVLGDKAKREARPSLLKRLRTFAKGKQAQNPQPPPKKEGGSDAQVNVGTIINLMAVDSFKVGEVTAYLHFLWSSTPVQFVLAIYLLYRILGYSSIAGIGIMVLLLPVNIVISKQFSNIQAKTMKATDARIHTTNEVLQNIRIIKYFAWEERFGQIVNEKRSEELRHLRNRYILWAVASTIWYGVPLVITFMSFFVYTVVEKKRLIPSVAFTALSLFSLLRIPLDQLADMLAHVQEAKVSVDRVDEFLKEEETEKYQQLRPNPDDSDEDPSIGLSDATLTWGGRDQALVDASAAFRLIDVNVVFQVGELNLIIGPTGSGKTSLLMALLGEMTLLDGAVHLPGGCSREDLRPDPETGLTESVAYCAQQAWLVNDTIKQNILFAESLDPKRYRDVIKACALERDLEILDAGDQTLVGEKGISLSGGQKQRISLARALYSNARHLLLDDCLSAVDSHTAKWIFDHSIMGPLMYGRTCILVTHNTALCLPHATHVVVMDNGKISSQGSPDRVIATGLLGDEFHQSRPGSSSGSRTTSRVQSTLNGNATDTDDSAEANGDTDGDSPAKIGGKDGVEDAMAANARTEEKAIGGVKWNIIWLYLTTMGPWYFWVAATATFVAQQLGSVATNVWIREWANAYHTERVQPAALSDPFPLHRSSQGPVSVLTASCFRSGSCAWSLPSSLFPHSDRTLVSLTGASEVDVSHYLAVYALIGVVYLLISLLREAISFGGSLNASWKIHKWLLESVTRAKFSFFDSTPLGQLMNRFSKDIEAIDQEVAPVALGMVHCSFTIVTVIILISVITPSFLIAAFFISAMYFFIGKFYIRSSRDLKRLESVQRSPLYQQFGETLSGITTIRAYGDERRFVRDNLARINTQARPFIYMWATNRWLAFRVDIVGALVAFFAGAFVISSVGRIDAGAAGLSLTYAVTFTENVLWLVRLYAINEQNMNSVERVKEYLDVQQEAKAIVPERRPPGNWPSKGAVEFSKYTTRYRSDLEPVLRNISFRIRPLEKVGIVGRTGAGKSSLALALFRGLEAEHGKIVIDEVDVGLIGLQDLRENVTIVPQDPTLFSGTIRSNLDPFGIFTDEEIFTSLRRVHLIDSTTSTPAPSTPNLPGTPEPEP
ncbi:MAG: hypothetical protein M1838_005641, partial [Thelocarpon superellum]